MPLPPRGSKKNRNIAGVALIAGGIGIKEKVSGASIMKSQPYEH